MGFAIRFLKSVLAIALAVLAVPATAQLVTLNAESLTGDERQVMIAVRQTLDGIDKPAVALAAIERILEQSSLSARSRVLLYGFRAGALTQLGRGDEGFADAERAVAAIPGDALGSALIANMAFQRDDWARAARELETTLARDPTWVTGIDQYHLMMVFDRLERPDTAEMDALRLTLARRLFDAGWRGGSVALRSTLARELAEDAIDVGKVDAARAFVVRIERPSDFYWMLSESRFAPLHETIEQWAGHRLEKQWPIYLESLREEFRRNPGDSVTAASLAGGLRSAHRYQEVVLTVLPTAMAEWRKTGDGSWTGPIIVSASMLSALNRFDDALRTLAEGEALAAKDDPHAINFPANRAIQLIDRADYAKGAALLDEVIAGARGNEAVSLATMARFQSLRLCARHRAGHADAMRAADDHHSEWATRQPGMIADLWLCLGKRDRARDAWLAAIAADPKERYYLLAYLQPSNRSTPQGAHERAMMAANNDLRRDPDLLAAVRPIGRVLGWPISEKAPRD